jgi:hypothetical protein
MYDPSVMYSSNDFRLLNSNELLTMFREAKIVVAEVQGIKLIKKVQKDIANMRVLLNGFDAVHNEEQNVR